MTHAEAKAGLAKDLEEMRDDLGKKTKECDALKAMVGKVEKGLATLRDASKANKDII